MRVCIVGAGAIGSFIGTRLSQNGCEVSAIARGATAASLRTHGFRMEQAGALDTAPVRVAEDGTELGTQDLVVLSVKGPSLTGAARKIPPLLGPDTIVLTAMNGVPWWFFYGANGALADLRLDAIDPQALVGEAVPARHVLGCVVHATCSVVEPGLVRHGFGNELIVGDPVAATSARVERVATALRSAGFTTKVSAKIQRDIWYKLWGNMTMNPLSALTGATCDKILDDPFLSRYCLSIMAEAAAIGDRIDCPITERGEDRIAVTRKLGAFKTSMLQDAEAGRPLEIDSLLTAVAEIGAKVDVPTPNLNGLLGMIRVFERVRANR